LQSLLGKPFTFALSNYYAKNYERGRAPEVARRQGWVLTGLCLLAVTAGFGVGRTIVSEEREHRR
jgi:hypothetical protein